MRNFMYQNLNRDAVKIRLYQMGTVSNVYIRTEDETDGLNNRVPAFEVAGETIIFAHWGGATDEERDTEFGEFNKVTPTFIFPHDSIIKDDAHVFYDGAEYEITATTSRGNHIVSDGKQVNMLSNENGTYNVYDEDGNELELPVES